MTAAVWTAPPWEDPKLIGAAMELACDVREYGIDHVRDQIGQIDVRSLVDLLIVTAAMVDDERTTDEVLAWTDPLPADLIERYGAKCRNGHTRRRSTTQIQNGRVRACLVCVRDTNARAAINRARRRGVKERVKA